MFFCCAILFNMKKLLKLFLTFFKIGLFTFGGGYAMISLVQNEFVDKQKAVTEDEFLDLIAIAESTPGPIAINMATYIGYKAKGIWGAILATLGVILPSFTIIFIISLFLGNFLEYPLVQKAFRGISCAVAVIILFAGIKLLKNVKKSVLPLTVFVVTILLMVLDEINIINFPYLTIAIILSGGLIGILTLISNEKRTQKTISKSSNEDKEEDL